MVSLRKFRSSVGKAHLEWVTRNIAEELHFRFRAGRRIDLENGVIVNMGDARFDKSYPFFTHSTGKFGHRIYILENMGFVNVLPWNDCNEEDIRNLVEFNFGIPYLNEKARETFRLLEREGAYQTSPFMMGN